MLTTFQKIGKTARDRLELLTSIYSKGNATVNSNESVMQVLLNHSICRKLDQNNTKNNEFQIYSKEFGGV